MPISDKYIGAPYKLRGCSIAEGYDCGTLVASYLLDLHRQLPGSSIQDFLNGKLPHKAMADLVTWVRTEGGRVTQAPWMQGDVCLFRVDLNDPEPSHLGVMVDSSRFLHIHREIRACIEDMDAERFVGFTWRSRLESVWRLPWG